MNSIERIEEKTHHEKAHDEKTHQDNSARTLLQQSLASRPSLRKFLQVVFPFLASLAGDSGPRHVFFFNKFLLQQNFFSKTACP